MKITVIATGFPTDGKKSNLFGAQRFIPVVTERPGVDRSDYFFLGPDFFESVPPAIVPDKRG